MGLARFYKQHNVEPRNIATMIQLAADLNKAKGYHRQRVLDLAKKEGLNNPSFHRDTHRGLSFINQYDDVCYLPEIV